jgi:hypothetical protein
MGPFLDFAKEPLNDIGRPDRLPMRFGKSVESQTGLQVTLQTGYRSRINWLIFGDERGHLLVSLLTAVLVEDRFEFRRNLVALFSRDVAQDVVHFVFDTALTFTGGEFCLDRVEHGLIAIADPQGYLLHTPAFEVIQQLLPGQLVLFVADTEAQHLPFAGQIDPDHRQNRHFVTLAVVNDRKIGPIGKEIGILCRQWTLLPGRKLFFQGMKDPRYGRGTRLVARQKGFAESHIVREVEPPDPEMKDIIPFTEQEVKLMLVACHRSQLYWRPGQIGKCNHSLSNRERNKAIILTLLDTGLRASELCNATIADLDLVNKRISVIGKGNK